MSSGEISGNTAAYGGGLSTGKTSFTMNDGTVSGNTARENGGGVYVANGGNITKTGGIITGYTNGTNNGNTVKESSGTIRNHRGHAVYAGSTDTVLKIKESTTGQDDNLSYVSARNGPTASGDWDN
jgi:parallel beta-helix repeat protein